MFLSEFLRIPSVSVCARFFSPWYQQILSFFLFYSFFILQYVYICIHIYLFFLKHFFRCPPLLSSSFRLFICLLPGCFFSVCRTINVFYARTLAKTKMWFGLDGSFTIIIAEPYYAESLGIFLFFFSSFFFILVSSLSLALCMAQTLKTIVPVIFFFSFRVL